MPTEALAIRGHDVGTLCRGRPPYIRNPPIETVAFSWGVAEDGQLGLDTDKDQFTPKVVEALLGTRFRGREFSRGPLIAGSRNSLAIEADGEVLSWGWNARGTLGQGHKINTVPKPSPVSGLDGIRIVQAALGGWHTMLLDSEGQVWACGGNEYGQCGCAFDKRDVLVPSRCVPQLQVQQVAAGGMHSLALTTSGQVWMWGEIWGDFSMTPDRRPRCVEGARDIVQITCGAFHNLALDSAGQVFAWGINDFGQLGTNDTAYATFPQPVVGLEGVAVADVEAGGWHSLAISSEGVVYVWGRGEYGRLGLGDRGGASKLRPTLLASLSAHKVVHASCGGTHTMVVTDEGRLFVWGRGSFGRLGTGNASQAYHPVEVQLPGGLDRWRIIDVACGGRHTLLLAVPDNGNLRKTLSAASVNSGSTTEGQTWRPAAPQVSEKAKEVMSRLGYESDSEQTTAPGRAAGTPGSDHMPHTPSVDISKPEEGSMGDDELDELQSPGYDSEAPPMMASSFGHYLQDGLQATAQDHPPFRDADSPVALTGGPYILNPHPAPEPRLQPDFMTQAAAARSSAQPVGVPIRTDATRQQSAGLFESGALSSAVGALGLPEGGAAPLHHTVSTVTSDGRGPIFRNDTLDSLEMAEDAAYRRTSTMESIDVSSFTASTNARVGSAAKAATSHDLAGPSDD